MTGCPVIYSLILPLHRKRSSSLRCKSNSTLRNRSILSGRQHHLKKKHPGFEQFRGGSSSMRIVCLLFVGCLTSQQHASVSQGRICKDKFTCCHTEIEVSDPTFYLTQSQYTDTGPTSPSADPIMQGTWQGSHWSASFEVTGMTRPGKIPSQAIFKPRIFCSRGRRHNH